VEIASQDTKVYSSSPFNLSYYFLDIFNQSVGTGVPCDAEVTVVSSNASLMLFPTNPIVYQMNPSFKSQVSFPICSRLF
jgi:hypothetical protein